MGKPQLLWLIFTGIGILSIVGLLVYNKVVNKKKFLKHLKLLLKIVSQILKSKVKQ